MTIKKIIGREILDSRGYPTVQVEVELASGIKAQASIPSGASTGSNEACELRDKDMRRYNGKGVLKAVNNINTEIASLLLGKSAEDITWIDETLCKLDSTTNKQRLGANAILGTSLAIAKAIAIKKNQKFYEYIAEISSNEPKLPTPMMNVINGGLHANNGLDIQEFMIIPVGFDKIAEAIRCGAEIFHALGNILTKSGISIAVGDEGGYAPNLKSHTSAIKNIIKAVNTAGYKEYKNVELGLDMASSSFYDGIKYNIKSENESFTSDELVDYLNNIANTYPLTSIEDGMAENDLEGWKSLTNKMGHNIQLVGDDLFVTNINMLKHGIEAKIANAILIKPNQIGTLSETLATVALAKSANYKVIVSHRSGETEDVSIADIAVGVAADYIKTGSLCRTERVAKYNRLMKIESYLMREHL